MKRFVIVAVLFMFVTVGFAAQRVVPVTNAPVQTKTQGPSPQTMTPPQIAQITILSPSGGEWKQGTTMPIRFTISKAAISWVNIFVKKGSDTFYSFPHIAADRNPVMTTFNWTIPNDAIIGKNYTIEVVSENSAAIHKASNPFDIISAANPNVSAIGTMGTQKDLKPNMSQVSIKNINVTSPTTGDHWVSTYDKSITVKWDHPSFPKVNTVNIKLLKGDGTLLKPLAANIPYNAGSFNWKLTGSGITPGEYRIRVTDAESIDIEGTSDPFFFDAPITNMTITSPAPGAMLRIGMKYDFSWTYDGSDKQTIKIMDDDGVIAENVPINAGNIGPGKGSYKVAIQQKYWGKNTTIHLRTPYSSVDNASVYFSSVYANLNVTAPNHKENWGPYSVHEITWAYNGNPDDILKITVEFIGETDYGLHTIATTKASAGSFMMNMDVVRKYMSDTGKNPVQFHIRMFDPYGGSTISADWITCQQ